MFKVTPNHSANELTGLTFSTCSLPGYGRLYHFYWTQYAEPVKPWTRNQNGEEDWRRNVELQQGLNQSFGENG